MQLEMWCHVENIWTKLELAAGAWSEQETEYKLVIYYTEKK